MTNSLDMAGLSLEQLEELVPTHKCDVEPLTAAIRLGYPTVAPIMPKLLEWIQDCNWPVADILMAFMASIGEPMLPYLRDVLATGDEGWMDSVLLLAAASPAIATALLDDLRQLEARHLQWFENEPFLSDALAVAELGLKAPVYVPWILCGLRHSLDSNAWVWIEPVLLIAVAWPTFAKFLLDDLRRLEARDTEWLDKDLVREAIAAAELGSEAPVYIPRIFSEQ